MAIKDTAALRAWAAASPAELEAMAAAEDEARKTAGTAEDDAGDFVDLDAADDAAAPAEGFSPEDAEMYADDIAAELADGGGDDAIIALVDGYDPAEGIPRWVGDPDIWDGAVDLATETVEQDDPIFWQVVGHIYQYLQGPIEEPGVVPESVTVEGPEEAEEET